MRIKITLVLSFLVFLISCKDKEEECFEQRIAYVGEVNAPAIAKVNEVVDVEVKFGLPQQCGRFAKFTESRSGNTRTIEVQAYHGTCLCLAQPMEVTAYYKFVAPLSGRYELKFKSHPTSADNFVTVFIDVE